MRNILNKSMAAGALSALISPVLAAGYSYSYTTKASDPVAGTISLVMTCCICLFAMFFLGISIFVTVDALKRDYGTDQNMKLISLLLIWVVGPIGVVLYYFLVMRKYPKLKN